MEVPPSEVGRTLDAGWVWAEGKAPLGGQAHMAVVPDHQQLGRPPLWAVTLLPLEAVPPAARIKRFPWTAAWHSWRKFERQQQRAPGGPTGRLLSPAVSADPPPGWDFEKGQAPFATQITV